MEDAEHNRQRIQGLLLAGANAEAQRLSQEWLKSAPTEPRAWFSVAVCRHVCGDIEGALSAFDEVLRLCPGHVQALSGRGSMLSRLGRHETALESYSEAVQRSPRDPELRLNQAVVLESLDRWHEALQIYSEAIHLDPDFLPARMNRGLLLARMHRFEEAIGQSEALATACPNSLLAQLNHAEIALRACQYQCSLEACERALGLEADNAAALIIQAISLAALGRLREAAGALAAAHRDPAAAQACCRDLLGDTAGARDALALGNIWFRSAWQRLCECDWRHYHEDAALAGRLFSSGDQGLGALTGLRYYQALKSFAVDDGIRRLHALRYTRQLQHSLRPQVFISRETGRDQRLRLGYLLDDPASEPLLPLLLPVLCEHQHQSLHITVYCLDEMQGLPQMEALCATADACANLSTLSEREAAYRIYQDGIDLLVAINAPAEEASGPVVMAHRPAPVQVWYGGHSGTSGAPWMDYALVDRYSSPPGDRPYWTEHRALLPAPAIALSTAECVTKATPRKALGLPEAGVVFCCLNRPEKIEPLVFDAWMRILLRVPDSLLWLQIWDQAQVSRLLAEADFRGVSAGRLHFAPHEQDRRRYLAQLAAADLYLDTYLSNGFIRVTDALLAGVPPLACTGRDVCGRRTAALLRALEMEEQVCPDLAAYESLAVALATDALRLDRLRRKLRRQHGQSKLFDARCQAGDLEAAYSQMWALHEGGRTPEEFSV